MSWLTDVLDKITGKRQPEPPQEPPTFPYGETQTLIGEAVAVHIPADAIRDGAVFYINVVISGSYELTEIHLKMRIDSGLCVKMMEWPENAKSECCLLVVGRSGD